MAEVEENGIPLRIDLDLNLAPPPNSDFMDLDLASEEPRSDQTLRHSPRTIWPRFGPGHSFWDPNFDNHSSSSLSHERVEGVHTMRRPHHSESRIGSNEFRNRQRIRGYSRPSLPTGRSYLGPLMQTARPEDRPSTVADLEPRDHIRTRGEMSSPFSRLDGSCDKIQATVKEEAGNNPSDNFDCNICLDISVEPVLTSCGHLFCWPCLYRWLYVHSDVKECPVCKSLVSEMDIIPIYGRGSTSGTVSRQLGEDSLIIPPRPHARQVERSRQRRERNTPQHHQRERDIRRDAQREIDAEMWHLNEDRSMQRAFRFLQDNIGTIQNLQENAVNMMMGMSLPEVRERFRSFESTVEDVTRQRSATMPQNLESNPRIVEGSAAIHTRLARLVETIDLHRRNAPSAGMSLEITLPVAERSLVHMGISQDLSSSHNVQGASTRNLSSLGDPSARLGDTRSNGMHAAMSYRRQRRRRVLSDASASGSAEIDYEFFHGRKRRRLNPEGDM